MSKQFAFITAVHGASQPNLNKNRHPDILQPLTVAGLQTCDLCAAVICLALSWLQVLV